MIVALVKREREFGGVADVVPTGAELRSTRNLRSAIQRRQMRVQRQRRQNHPALAEKWNAARSEPRHPNHFDRIRLVPYSEAPGGNSEKIVVDHIDVIPRGEPVRWIQNVRLAPADELLSHFQGDRTLGIGSAQ